MSTPLFPLSVWQSGTNENSIPANDNALRVQVLMAPAIDVADSEPGSPSEDDIHVIGTAWGGFTENNVVIYKGGVWLEWEAFEGWVKVIDGQQNYFDGTDWVLGGGGSGIPDAPSDGKLYGRKDAAWEEVPGGGGGAVDSVNGRTGAVALTGADTPSTVITLSGDTYNLGDLTPGAWHVFTSATAVTITVEDDSVEPVPANAEYGMEGRGAGGVTLVEDSAVTIISPKGGTLGLEADDFAVLKRTDANEYKLVGSTVAV